MVVGLNEITVGNVTFRIYVDQGPHFYSQSQFQKLKSALESAASVDSTLFGDTRTVDIQNRGDTIGLMPNQTNPHELLFNGNYLDSVATADGPSFINQFGERTLFSVERLLVHEMVHVDTAKDDPTIPEMISALEGGGGNDTVQGTQFGINEIYGGDGDDWRQAV